MFTPSLMETISSVISIASLHTIQKIPPRSVIFVTAQREEHEDAQLPASPLVCDSHLPLWSYKELVTTINRVQQVRGLDWYVLREMCKYVLSIL